MTLIKKIKEKKHNNIRTLYIYLRNIDLIYLNKITRRIKCVRNIYLKILKEKKRERERKRYDVNCSYNYSLYKSSSVRIYYSYLNIDHSAEFLNAV